MKLSCAKSAILISMCLYSITLQAQTFFEKLGDSITGGTASVNMRYRSELVNQDNALENANASTLRTRLTLSSAEFDGLSFLLEADNVSSIFSDDYDSLVLDEFRGNHSVVADPVGTEINQALIRFRPNENNVFTLGNQRIVHAGQRFVGGVAWRQNEQTFDAARWQHSGNNFSIDYSYMWNINRIFAGSRDSVQATNLRSDSHSAIASFNSDIGTFSTYLYALDFDNAAALSSLTLGVSYTGQFESLAINAAVGTQSDYGNNPVDYSAEHFTADIAYPVGPIQFLLGYEMLGSDNGNKSFATPLATLHAFQGWADLFLATPAAGLEDKYASMSGKIGTANLSATYHRFESDEGGIHYGNEWNLIANFPILPKVNGQLKYASYDAKSHAVDTDKLWFSLMLSF